MNNSFEINLRTILESSPVLSREGEKILAILNGPETRRRARQIRRMEFFAAAHLEHTGALQAINWDTVSWPTIIYELIKLFLAILPFLLLSPIGEVEDK